LQVIQERRMYIYLKSTEKNTKSRVGKGGGVITSLSYLIFNIRMTLIRPLLKIRKPNKLNHTHTCGKLSDSST
jgi:hypothetical protein